MRMKGSQAARGLMAAFLRWTGTAPAAAAGADWRMSYWAGTALPRRSRPRSTTQARDTTEPTMTVSSGPMK